MALPSSGSISISQIKTELGSSSNSLRTLSSQADQPKSSPDGMSEFRGYVQTQYKDATSASSYISRTYMSGTRNMSVTYQYLAFGGMPQGSVVTMVSENTVNAAFSKNFSQMTGLGWDGRYVVYDSTNRRYNKISIIAYYENPFTATLTVNVDTSLPYGGNPYYVGWNAGGANATSQTYTSTGFTLVLNSNNFYPYIALDIVFEIS
jgi:hypothetical protein